MHGSTGTEPYLLMMRFRDSQQIRGMSDRLADGPAIARKMVLNATFASSK